MNMLLRQFCIKEARKNHKHVDTVVNIFQVLPFPVKKAISNLHNNPRQSVDFYKRNTLRSSFWKISNSYKCTTSCTTYLIFSQGSKFCIGINCSSDDLKSPPIPLNGSSSLVISGMTLHFYLEILTKMILQ